MENLGGLREHPHSITTSLHGHRIAILSKGGKERVDFNDNTGVIVQHPYRQSDSIGDDCTAQK